MIKQLQKLKAKKGFTLLELIIVIAIIGVLVTMIIVGLDTDKAVKDSANTYSRDVYNAAQSIFTKYSLYEAPLSLQLKAQGAEAESDSTKEYDEFVRFYKKAGGNFPCKPSTINPTDMPDDTDLFIELVTKDGIITEVNAENTFEALLKRTSTKGAVFGEIFKNDIASRVEIHEGYYYMQVSYEKPADIAPGKPAEYVNTVKVMFVSYSKNRLPTYGGSDWGAYETEHLFFTDNYITKDGFVRGVFGPQVKAPTDASKTADRGTKGTYLSKETPAPAPVI